MSNHKNDAAPDTQTPADQAPDVNPESVAADQARRQAESTPSAK